MDYPGRVHRFRSALEESRLDAAALTHLPNVRYLCGFTGSSGVLVITDREALLFTDGRYTQQAQNEVKGAKIRISRKSSLLAAAEWMGRQRSSRRIGIEAAHLTVSAQGTLRNTIPKAARFMDATPALVHLRMVKDSQEVGLIRQACRLGVELFEKALKEIRPGITESHVAGKLEFEARKAGVDEMAFPTIIAAGLRSALPHGRASSQPIPRRAFVVCDFGVILAGYCSDMTRTVHVGRPQAEVRQGYKAVREAQQAALETVKPGATADEVDRMARKLLQKNNLSKFFTHSTGHGLGLEIHEAPRIAAHQNEVLRPGMVITIEPGVYLPGKWGVRIEDTVVVTDTGCEVLTACPKQLMTL
jgi:Xaa-Pro aminopeptidase